MKESTLWLLMALVALVVVLTTDGQTETIALAGEFFFLAVSAILRAIERIGDAQ